MPRRCSWTRDGESKISLLYLESSSVTLEIGTQLVDVWSILRMLDMSRLFLISPTLAIVFIPTAFSLGPGVYDGLAGSHLLPPISLGGFAFQAIEALLDQTNMTT